MKLIIAEKPELGRAIAEAIPGSARNEQSVIYKGDYAIVWAYGHLLTLKEPEDYDPAYKKWTLEALPIYFPDWGQKPNPQGNGHVSKAERLRQIGGLLSKCECVIHAGDPDDEGQYLIDEILRWHHYEGQVWRINTNDTTPAALQRAMENLTDNRLSVNRGWSAHARSVADMLVGYNCSRYFTLKNPEALLTIGRVQTATLGLVVARDAAIEGHVRQVYYEVAAQLALAGEQVEAKYEPRKEDPALDDGRILDPAYAGEKADMLEGAQLHGVRVTQRSLTEQPPLPFNLTELQSYCSSRFGYDPTRVLNITQTLRDRHGAITYNRSDCQYLSEEQYKNAPATMEQVIANIHYRPRELDTKLHSRAFDDSRISAHTAIIPQNKAIDLDDLTEEERKVYLAICKYYMAQFLPPAEKTRTSLQAPLPDGASLKATSTVVDKPGYLTIFRGDKAVSSEEDNPSGPLSRVQPGTYDARVEGTRIDEKQTKPPARYTKASLGKDMTRIARYVEDPQVKKLLLEKDRDKEGENGSIGTVATRGPIIDKLVERGYFQETGKKLISTPLGRELYRILPDELKKSDMTATWWAIQEDIQEGTRPWTDLTDSVLEMVRRVVATEYPHIELEAVPAQYRRSSKGIPAKEILGTCPRCGGRVVESKLGFGCASYRSGCRFVIWKKSKLPMMAQSSVGKTCVRTWLSKPWTREEDGTMVSAKGVIFKKLVSRKGSTFEAEIRLADPPGNPYGPEFRLIFPDQRSAPGAQEAAQGTQQTTPGIPGARKAEPGGKKTKPRGAGKGTGTPAGGGSPEGPAGA